MDPRISKFGNELLAPVAAQKPVKAGRTAPLNPNDLNFINVNKDNKITVDELKGALATQRGVAVESLALLPEEEAELAEDAKDLTSFIRRGGKLEGSAEQGFAYTGVVKQPSLKELRTADNFENPIQLAPGAKGEDIRKLNTLINNLYALDEEYKPLDERNEVYGEALRDAVADFQRKYQLIGTEGVQAGILDGKTLRAIERQVEGVIKAQDIYTPFVP
ncbi:hypothetical protein COW20_03935, partial [bacterium (Candidatus Blackallbacteria) CG13_big_fil_rev_8_21_14_2_50_49_14]